MFTNPLRITNDVNPVLLKADVPISVTLLGIINSPVMFTAALKAFRPTAVQVVPISKRVALG